MDPHHLQRLQEEQKRAIHETDAKIGQLKQFKDDYKALQERLKTLPDKVTHNIMVPFGKLAFMPGRIVHTNEILVLLGDNWFAERSAKQAAEIVERRIQGLNEKLKDLEDQRKLLTPRLDFTSDLRAELEGQGNVQEIMEEYDEEKERLWDEQHRKNVKRYKETLRQKDVDSQPAAVKKDEASHDRDAALWSRLDELERLEAERGEMDSDANEEEDDFNNHEDMSKTSTSRSDRRVSWADEKLIAVNRNKEEIDSDDMIESDTEESDAEESDEDDDDESEDTVRPVRLSQRTIYFKHSDTPAILPHQVSASGDSSIQSPADIYKMFCPKKSILKKPEDSGELLTDETHSVSAQGGDTTHNLPKSDNSQDETAVTALRAAARSSADKAFTGLVVEKPVSMTPNTQQSSSQSSSRTASSATGPAALAKQTSDDPPKRVSKFRASRNKQNSS